MQILHYYIVVEYLHIILDTLVDRARIMYYFYNSDYGTAKIKMVFPTRVDRLF